MEIEDAILNLSNPDESIQGQAIDLCSKFQTQVVFDIEVLHRL